MANLPPYSHLRFDSNYHSGPHSPDDNPSFVGEPSCTNQLYANTAASSNWHWTPQLASSSMAYHPTEVPLFMSSSPSYSAYAPPPQQQIRPPIAIQLSSPSPPSPPSFASDPHIHAAQEGSSATQQQRVREKRHQCNMCYKAFDRPSTLKKVWVLVSVINQPN